MKTIKKAQQYRRRKFIRKHKDMALALIVTGIAFIFWTAVLYMLG